MTFRRMWYVAVLIGCVADEVRYPVSPRDNGTPGDSTPSDSLPPGDVQKAQLVVGISLELADSSITRSLGWSSPPSGITVVVRRQNSTFTATAAIGQDGFARFVELIPGAYDLSVIRTLTPEEVQRLEEPNLDVDAFAGGRTITVTAPTTTVQVPFGAGRRGSLVISELSKAYPRDVSGNEYRFAKYLEIYNNTDTTIALTDKALVGGFPGSRDGGNFPCYLYDDIYKDSLGIWATVVFRFPPNAPPLLPGTIAVIATDAIDHGEQVPGGYDLSSADFEFKGSADVDNPRVPNMIVLGPYSGDTPWGHGFEWYQVWEVVALAYEVDVSTLPHRGLPSGGERQIARVPAANILDVLTTNTIFANDRPLCPAGAVHPSFDRQSIHELLSNDQRSVQRRVLSTEAGGRKILQRTKTSSRDFFAAPGTPFALP